MIGLFLTVSNVAAQQYTLTDEDVVVENGMITSCSYDFTLKDIIIPETLDGQTVTGIRGTWYNGIFQNKGITSIKLPPTITLIGSRTFADNDLVTLDLTNCTEIDTIVSMAFYSNSLTSLDLSHCTKLIYIGDEAFSRNSIESLDLSNLSSLVDIGESAFAYNKITSLDFSDCSELTFIGSYAFSNNQITDLDLSVCTALSSIGASAFRSNQLTNIDLTSCSNLLSIGEQAFIYNYSLSGFHLPEVSYDGTVYSTWLDGNDNRYAAGTDLATDLGTFYLPLIPYTLTDEDVVVENGIITSCSYDFALKNIIIPETLDGQTVTGIRGTWYNGIFQNKGITSIKLPPTITLIGSRTFADNDLVTLDLTNCTEIDTIVSMAFYSNSLTSLDLSHCTKLIYIGDEAFSRNSIESLDLSNLSSLVDIGESSFSYNTITSLDFSDCSAAYLHWVLCFQ